MKSKKKNDITTNYSSMVLYIVYCVLCQANHRPSGPFTVVVMSIKYGNEDMRLRAYKQGNCVARFFPRTLNLQLSSTCKPL